MLSFPVDSTTPNITKTDLEKMIADLDTCPIKNSGTRVVHPVGDGSSRVMFIGEAPGAKEDQLGEPFVGAAGNLLNKELLPSIGLSRENIYLTNIVKCRPPANRDPTDEEKLAWSPILLAEIALTKPKVIACLGRHSLGFFLPEAKISRVHGVPQPLQIFTDLQIDLLPLYHPAVALYNGSMKQTLLDDFQVITGLIK
jgi:DNA polymerase